MGTDNFWKRLTIKSLYLLNLKTILQTIDTFILHLQRVHYQTIICKSTTKKSDQPNIEAIYLVWNKDDLLVCHQKCHLIFKRHYKLSNSVVHQIIKL
jgi:hypothetical protein